VTCVCEADIDAVLDIETASFPAPWHRASFEGQLLEKTSRALAIKQTQQGGPDRFIAYIFFALIDNQMRVLNLAVDSAYRRQGLATFLLQYTMTLARKYGISKMYLEVRPSNHPAIGLYKKTGFIETGRKPEYYLETREDAIVMVKDIRTSKVMQDL
jgi:ribosomal-protein-alanine N-acetyltransferase